MPVNLDNPFARSIHSCDLPPAKSTEPSWFGLYQGKVTLLIGETGAGKSSLLYNMGVHGGLSLPLWAVPFGLDRPLKTLYIDPENAGNFVEGDGGLCRVKLDRIGQGQPEPLVFHDGQGIDLSNSRQMNHLQEYVQEQAFDVIVLDPIANLFNTQNEDDNAEAARQMKMLNGLSRTTGACVVAVHHTGKTTTSEYGRGASARLGAADVGLMFRVRGSEEEEDDTYTPGNGMRQREDICRFQIVKNRMDGKGSLYLRMAGADRFELATFEEWKTASRSETPETRAARVKDEVLLHLLDGAFHPRAEIVEAMKREGISQGSTDTALAALLSTGEVIRRSGGGRGGSWLYQRTGLGQLTMTPDAAAS
jgi:hypothetical protein